MSRDMLILAINPGSTSTKIAVYSGDKLVSKDNIFHKAEELLPFGKICEQYEYRIGMILEWLFFQEIRQEELVAVVGRGGLLRPLAGGTYAINELMVQEMKEAKQGEHASNLGIIMAYALGKKLDIPAFVVDPVAVDEMEPYARISGMPEITRLSQSHALNMKAVARKVAKEMEKSYFDLNLIVVHLGSGISVSPHKKGKMIDVNNANNEGPFSPERCGGLPTYELVKLCYSGKYTEEEMLAKLLKVGGMYAYLGTKDVREVRKMIAEGNEQAKLILDTMVYQVAKEIGAMSTVLEGQVDAIVITGGIAFDQELVAEISKRVSFIAPIKVVPGEEELESLAIGALRVLTGEENAKIYI